MSDLYIIGTGNLGLRLCKAFTASNQSFKLAGYFNRSNTIVNQINAPLLIDFKEINKDAIVIIATPDKDISSISNSIEPDKSLVVHCSGSISIDALHTHNNRAVMYLPQTFTAGREIDLAALTLCLEASNEASMKKVERLSSTLSRKRNHINSLQRKQLHLSAVFLNNFVNHCVYKSQELMKDADLDQRMLYPLLKETIVKAMDLGAYDAQTGPARRGDTITINEHLELLQDKKLYKSITDSILKTYKHEL